MPDDELSAAPAEEAPPAAARPDRATRSGARSARARVSAPGRHGHEAARGPVTPECAREGVDEPAGQAVSAAFARAARSRGPMPTCRARGAVAHGARRGAGDRRAQRAGRRGRHRRRQDLRVPGADLAERRARAGQHRDQEPAGPAVPARPAAPARGPAAAGHGGAAEGPRQLPLPAPAEPGAPGAQLARPLGGAHAAPRSSSGRTSRSAATWPNSTAWTSAAA